jgi:uncharacterized protein (TIGR02594 family)
MKTRYLVLSLVLLAALTKGNSAEDYMIDPREIVAVEPPTKLSIAIEFLNFTERSNRAELKQFIGVDPVRIDWCAAFVNAVLQQIGIPGSESISDYPLVARSFLTWGKRVKDPRPGDIVVFPRGKQPWQGHVGFYYGTVYENGKKFYQILGGNQDNSVNIKLFPARSAISIRRYQIENLL